MIDDEHFSESDPARSLLEVAEDLAISLDGPVELSVAGLAGPAARRHWKYFSFEMRFLSGQKYPRIAPILMSFS